MEGFLSQWQISMKMSSPGMCCDHCFSIIAEKSTSAARLWLDLCEWEAVHGMFSVVEKLPFDGDILFLELMGFILTTDLPFACRVKVLGKQKSGSETIFCLRKYHNDSAD